jgi:tetratricopeptide (TPR) repeat protein
MNALCRWCCLLLLSSLLIINPKVYYVNSRVDADGAGKQHSSAEDYLYLGSTALSEDDNAKAIDLYEKGIAALKDDGSESIITILSLETNIATAYSAIGGDVREKIIEHYEKAISAYDQIDPIVDKEIIEDAKSIASQSYFFYGMVLQDMEGTQQKSLEMYAYAVVLDPNLWAAWGNLGASEIKIMAYQNRELLTQYYWALKQFLSIPVSSLLFLSLIFSSHFRKRIL